MVKSRHNKIGIIVTLVGAFAAGGLGGCGIMGEKKAPPPPMEFPLMSPYGEAATLGIGPAVNLSGSRDFDTLVVSDVLFAEMSQVQGLTVLPLNKTLMAMQRLGVRSIDSPATAQKVADAMGVDGLVIPAVTAYDPYNPPVIGLILQMYTSTSPGGPVIRAEVPRSNVPLVSPGGGISDGQRQPVSQVSAVFNASNQTVLRELRNYAVGRTEYDSALQERKFLADADSYMRFACHGMVRRLMDVERSRASDR